MEKDEAILKILNVIKHHYSSIEVADFWDCDLCAIGLKNNNTLIYISTWQKKQDLYYYEIELLNPDNFEQYKVLKKVDEVSEKELLQAIATYLYST